MALLKEMSHLGWALRPQKAPAILPVNSVSPVCGLGCGLCQLLPQGHAHMSAAMLPTMMEDCYSSGPSPISPWSRYFITPIEK